MAYSKEDIIKEYKKLRTRLGRPPDSKTFYRETPVSKRAAEGAFGGDTFSKIQRSAGDEPRQFATPGRSKDEFFEAYGLAVRQFQCLPTEADWNHRMIKPTPSGYRRKLGLSWSQVPHAFCDWAVDRSKWQDVVQLCNSGCAPEGPLGKRIAKEPAEYVYLIKCGRFHKIGRSNSPGRREYEVALQLPEEPRTVHLIKTDDAGGVETYWYNRFKDKRTRGEFFELSTDDVRAFKRWKQIW